MYKINLYIFLIVLKLLFSECINNVNVPSPCPKLKFLNGRIKYKQKGRLARFQCNSGFHLVGDRYNTCVRGKWELPPPFCVKPTCTKVKAPTNGLIYPSHFGAYLIFYCKPGFTLRGSNTTYCDGSRWNNNLPSCIESNTKASKSCDFESEYLCGWSHELNHDFEWRRQNFETPSGHVGTGPKFDHTKGRGKDGYYMYIESTSRLENDAARLVSPIYNKQPNGFCFTFYYHMYGATIGQLKVYVKRESETSNVRLLKPSFVESGNQGDVWKKGAIELANINEDFQIIIEGIRGATYVSDIAIDDVSLTDSCPEDEELFSSSTTEILTDDITPISIPSCQNRCGDIRDDTEDEPFPLCECVDSCIENNTCCPDYVDVCLIGTDFTEETESYPITTDHETTPFSTIKTTIVEKETVPVITQRPRQETTLPDVDYTKEVKKSKASSLAFITEKPTTNIIASNTKSDERVTAKPKLNTTAKPKLNTTAKPKLDTTAKPILKITTITVPKVKKNDTKLVTKTTSTTQLPNKKAKIVPTRNELYRTEIVTSTIPTTVKRTTLMQIKTKPTGTTKPTKPTTLQTKSTTVKQTTLAQKKTKSPATTKIIKSTTSDKLETLETLKIMTDYEETTELNLNSNVETIHPNVQMLSENSKIVTSESNSTLIFIVICSLLFIIVAVATITFFVKRRNLYCSRFKFKHSANTDSLSDVRFLTSDEILDFTWRNADN